MVIICIALEKELPIAFKKQYSNSWVRIAALKSGAIDQYKQQSFLIVIMGVGKPNDLDWLIEHLNPTEIINIGTAGSPSLSIGSWNQLLSISHDEKTIQLNTQTSLPIPYAKFNLVDGYTVNQMDLSINSDVIDMEAFFYAECCQQKNTSFTSFKFITDRNDFKTQHDFNQQLNLFHHQFNALLNHLFLPDVSISVIVPVFNRSVQFEAALASVLNQSLKPAEIIVVDDGSQPPIQINHDHVQLIRVDSNIGVSHARNLGIKAATSAWIAFLDSDDIWHEHHLESLVLYLKNNPLCRFLQTDETWIRNGKHFNKKSYHQKPSGWALQPSLERCLVSPSAVMIHHSLFDWYGDFNPNLIVCEDYDLWVRLLRYVPVGFVELVTMTKYGGHQDQLSTAYPAMDRFRVQSLIQLFNYEPLEFFRDLYAQVLIKKLTVLKKGASKRMQNDDLAYYDRVLNQLSTACTHLEECDVSSII